MATYSEENETIYTTTDLTSLPDLPFYFYPEQRRARHALEIIYDLSRIDESDCKSTDARYLLAKNLFALCKLLQRSGSFTYPRGIILTYITKPLATFDTLETFEQFDSTNLKPLHDFVARFPNRLLPFTHIQITLGDRRYSVNCRSKTTYTLETYLAKLGRSLISRKPPPSPKDSFPFFSLPAELRHLILRFALTPPSPSTPPRFALPHGVPLHLPPRSYTCCTTCQSLDTSTPTCVCTSPTLFSSSCTCPASPHPLFLTSRALRAEALQAYFKTTPFAVAGSAPTIQRLLTQRMPRRLIRHAPALNLLVRAPEPKELAGVHFLLAHVKYRRLLIDVVEPLVELFRAQLHSLVAALHRADLLPPTKRRGNITLRFVRYKPGPGILGAGPSQRWVELLYIPRDEIERKCEEVLGDIFRPLGVELGESVSSVALVEERQRFDLVLADDDHDACSGLI